jgi:hypothetical protein
MPAGTPKLRDRVRRRLAGDGSQDVRRRSASWWLGRSARTAVESNPTRTVLMAAEDALADFT